MAGIAEMAQQSATKLEEVEIGTPRIKKRTAIEKTRWHKKRRVLAPRSEPGAVLT
jgi:hypothetical protein